MGPAIRVPGGGGLVPADALSATVQVKKGSEPSSRWTVVQSNGVAHGICKRAWSEPGESGAAICGDRYAGDVNGVGENAARVVVGDDDGVGGCRVVRVLLVGCSNV